MVSEAARHKYIESQERAVREKERRAVVYSADDVKGSYPRTGGAHQTEGLETAPFHRLVLLAREHVYPDGAWNADTAPRRDESVRPSRTSVIMNYQRGVAGQFWLIPRSNSFFLFLF
jgi:hypothetical protein